MSSSIRDVVGRARAINCRFLLPEYLPYHLAVFRNNSAARQSSEHVPYHLGARYGGGLNPGSTQVRTLGLDQRGGRPNINIKNLGSTQVQPRFNPGLTQFEPRFNPGSNLSLTQVQPRFNPV